MTFGPWTPRHGSGWPSQFLKFSRVHHTCEGLPGCRAEMVQKCVNPPIRDSRWHSREHKLKAKLVSNCAFQRLQQGRPKAAKHASWRNTVFKGNFESEQNAMSGICYTASPLQRFISTLREVTRVIGALFEPRRSSGARHIVAA